MAADIEAIDAVISIRAGRKPKEEGQGPPPLRRCAKKLTLRKGPKPNEKDPKGDKLLALPVDAAAASMAAANISSASSCRPA